MKDPKPLVDHAYTLRNKFCEEMAFEKIDVDQEIRLKKLGKKIEDLKFFKLMYKESTVSLPGTSHHNQHMNWYLADDTLPIFLPSRQFFFYEDYGCNDIKLFKDNQNRLTSEGLDSFVYVRLEENKAATGILSTIVRISELQPISCLWMANCNDKLNHHAFRFSDKCRCILLYYCSLHSSTLDHILKQISNSTDLTKMEFVHTSLRGINCLGLQQLPSLTELCLINVDLQRFHVMHLGYLIKNGKLPKLSILDLRINNMKPFENDVGVFLKLVARTHKRRIEVYLDLTNLSQYILDEVNEDLDQPSFLHTICNVPSDLADSAPKSCCADSG